MNTSGLGILVLVLLLSYAPNPCYSKALDSALRLLKVVCPASVVSSHQSEANVYAADWSSSPWLKTAVLELSDITIHHAYLPRGFLRCDQTVTDPQRSAIDTQT